MLAAPKVGAPLKWVEDRRENLIAAGKSRHEHAHGADGVRRRRRDPGRDIDFVSDCGAYPTPWPVGARGRGRHAVPRAVPRPARRLRDQDGLHEHGRAHRVPRARGSSRRWPARCCSTSRPGRWASTPSSCAAATCCAATSCRTRTPTACRTTASRRSRRSSRRWRCSTTRRSAREQAEARTSRPATSAWACRTYVEPSTPGYGVLRDRGGDDPHRAVGHGQRVRRRRLGRQQHRDHGRAAHRRRARRDIDDVNTIQGDTAVTAFGAGAPGAGAAR